ncbi:UDP-glucose 4-epimerase GalE [Streptomyces poriferorum]|uniref:UDP-glucose 4-epimerase n=1 Tax=Streptomyces poriferorum TaxID=2798799 RepID=A0ABY9IY05_9ACTN|nr:MULTISPECIES: UDP-glucose 4-epimerase GalE [Streptomyces]MBW5252029.1 UDP-glucose 4-epimerase GalE [Streptomyces poriferorum]MBW5257389.1 UDP-glucose 4-epimerase GalE [Streptomyces poriferorum]MDP5311895.1 UDP-glucose 4-epimerase GalE [Streptomyces sp. Alt4]WLQ48273.1 UDP-glucose 4-epimerase GalE [Streptomyces sp. Alt1]WLQ59039.1 UDP-glucose 4-epimerase GalE [Streptomyces sp. Alt2]
MTWMVTGGAGYIGAHVVRAMLAGGLRVVVYDDLSTGNAASVPDGVPLVTGSVLDRQTLDAAIRDHTVTGVVHVAGKKQVGESVERPLHYYRENVTGLEVLLESMVAAGVDQLVFSSSAAVYGMPDVDLVTEDTPCAPMSPYGETKLVGEWLIHAAARAHGLRCASLRYFNVAGAASPELADAGVFNLIPMVFERLEAGEGPRIFGDDYATPDGTCVRDYIHVEDIASAHLAAARRLEAAGPGTDLTLNIGRGEGSSVREMVDRILKATDHGDIVPEVAARRAGDPARVVAGADRIRAELGWSARYGVDEMIDSAWQGWRLRHP